MVLLVVVSPSLDIEGEDAWKPPCSTTPPVGMCWKTTPPLVVAVGSELFVPMFFSISFTLGTKPSSFGALGLVGCTTDSVVSVVTFFEASTDASGFVSLGWGRCQTGVQSTRPPMTLHSHVREDCTLGRVLEDTGWVAVLSIPSSFAGFAGGGGEGDGEGKEV